MTKDEAFQLAVKWVKNHLPDSNDCTIWEDNIRLGYGYLWIKDFDFRVSRLILYLKYDGKIPEGILALHSCNNKACWNPKHIYGGDHRKNMEDLRNFNNLNPKTHCDKGHELTIDNLFEHKRKNGRIDFECRICKNEALRQYRYKRGITNQANRRIK